jgi:hypothetical protein
MIQQIAILRRAGLTAAEALKLVWPDNELLAYSQFPKGGDLVINSEDSLITDEGDDIEWQKRG